MYKPIWRMYQKKYLMQKQDRYLYEYIFFCIIYFGAALSGAICATDVPTVGASGMSFFLLGMLIMLKPTYKQVKQYIWIILALLVQWYFAKSNVLLHIVAFVEGCVFIILREWCRQYADRGIYKD